MSAASEARAEIAAAIRDGLESNVPVYDLLPPVIRPPLIALEPRDPYLEPLVIGGGRWVLRLAVAVIASAADMGSGFALVEDLAEQLHAILPAGVEIGTTSAPRLTDLGAQGPAIVLEIDITAPIERNPS